MYVIYIFSSQWLNNVLVSAAQRQQNVCKYTYITSLLSPLWFFFFFSVYKETQIILHSQHGELNRQRKEMWTCPGPQSLGRPREASQPWGGVFREENLVFTLQAHLDDIRIKLARDRLAGEHQTKVSNLSMRERHRKHN